MTLSKEELPEVVTNTERDYCGGGSGGKDQ